MFCTGRFSFIRVARFQCSPSVHGCWTVARTGRIKRTQNRLARSLPKTRNLKSVKYYQAKMHCQNDGHVVHEPLTIQSWIGNQCDHETDMGRSARFDMLWYLQEEWSKCHSRGRTITTASQKRSVKEERIIKEIIISKGLSQKIRFFSRDFFLMTSFRVRIIDWIKNQLNIRDWLKNIIVYVLVV